MKKFFYQPTMLEDWISANTDALSAAAAMNMSFFMVLFLCLSG